MADIKDIKEWIASNLNVETYDGEINEFVDWATGINEITGSKIQGVDENTQISGKSIRKLI